jgi:hypothetical protein
MIGPELSTSVNGPAVAVHPIASVTVKVYEPADKLLGFKLVPPPLLQAYVTLFPVAVIPVNEPFPAVQDSSVSTIAVALIDGPVIVPIE